MRSSLASFGLVDQEVTVCRIEVRGLTGADSTHPGFEVSAVVRERGEETAVVTADGAPLELVGSSVDGIYHRMLVELSGRFGPLRTGVIANERCTSCGWIVTVTFLQHRDDAVLPPKSRIRPACPHCHDLFTVADGTIIGLTAAPPAR